MTCGVANRFPFRISRPFHDFRLSNSGRRSGDQSTTPGGDRSSRGTRFRAAASRRDEVGAARLQRLLRGRRRDGATQRCASWPGPTHGCALLFVAGRRRSRGSKVEGRKSKNASSRPTAQRRSSPWSRRWSFDFRFSSFEPRVSRLPGRHCHFRRDGSGECPAGRTLDGERDPLADPAWAFAPARLRPCDGQR